MASRPFVDISFGPLLPDNGGSPVQGMPGYLTDAVNVRYTPNGYRGSPSFSDVASATAIGGSGMTYAHGWATHNSSVLGLWVATDSGTLYESRAEGTDTWQNVSPAVGSLDPSGDFVRFGNDVIFACKTHAPIYKSLASAQATV